MTGSLQLRAYLRDRAAGLSAEDAGARAGFSAAEIKLTEADRARGNLDEIGFAIPDAFIGHIDLAEPEAAGCAVDAQGEQTMPEDTEDTAVADLAADTLRGDVRDAMLSWFKATPKPWSQMGEKEQRDFADNADRAARELVRQACRIIAANERPCIVARLVEYKEKDGVEAKLKLASTGEIIGALHEACGREVLVVTSGEEEFSGEAAGAVIDADQPGIPGIGEEYDQAA